MHFNAESGRAFYKRRNFGNDEADFSIKRVLIRHEKVFFSLNTVLNYKEQVLESLRGEHVAALLKVRACEREIEALENQHKDCMEEFECQKRTGIAISKMKTYEGYLESLGVRILRKQEHLADLKEG